ILVDHDRIEPSNLPRQILFGEGDVGRSKAEVAAERLARPGLSARAVVARFDAGTAPALLAEADVVIDATDGPEAKDFVNAASVTAGRPLIHAAALGSEGRVLDVPPHGRPCLACLFGRLAAGGETGDTCARLGVWPGVAGATGALAAEAALARLVRPDAASRGLRVLDLAAGRGTTLGAAADPGCPVCGAHDRDAAARGDLSAPATASVLDAAPPDVLDLREESCPMNLLRARRAVERAGAGEAVEIWVGREGAATVPEGLASLGHAVLERGEVTGGERVLVRRARTARGPALAGTDAWLRRYARQIVLPEVGEDGQRRWNDARVEVAGTGPALVAFAVHLAAAGVGRLAIRDDAAVGDRAGRWPFAARDAERPCGEALAEALARHSGVVAEASAALEERPGVLRARVEDVVLERSVGALAQADGALLADHAMRRLLLGERAPPMIAVRADATVGR
ncbi:MAG TPA: ThiF family adenylyltransferase, partial [Planctomycetota bacterium]|nr:ThiF family adenylyltransferase [Planctomycetota bacterium]